MKSLIASAFLVMSVAFASAGFAQTVNGPKPSQQTHTNPEIKSDWEYGKCVGQKVISGSSIPTAVVKCAPKLESTTAPRYLDETPGATTTEPPQNNSSSSTKNETEPAE